jgi:hypothetical protein
VDKYVDLNPVKANLKDGEFLLFDKVRGDRS